MKRSVHHKPHWVSPHWRSYSRTPRIWGILSVNLCSFSKSALLLTPASVCTLRCINAQRDTNTSPRQEDVELENAVLEQGRGSWPHSSPGTHYGSVNRVQVVGDWFPRPGHGALQWWQLHNPHDSANICGRRARLGKSSARHQHREICFADPAGKHCWEFEGNFCLSSDRIQTCGGCTCQPGTPGWATQGWPTELCPTQLFQGTTHVCDTIGLNSPRTSPAQPLGAAAAPYLDWAQTCFGFAFLSIFVLFSRINSYGMCLKHSHKHWASGRAAGEIMARF